MHGCRTRVVGAGLAVLVAGLSSASPVHAAATWSAPFALSGADTVPGEPRLAMDGRGDAVVAWITPDSRGVVRARLRAPGGSFGAPVTLSPPGVVANDLDAAIDAKGDAVVAWTGGDAAAAPILQASTRPAGATFGPAVTVSDPDIVGRPEVGMSDTGEIVMAWPSFPPLAAETVEMTSIRPSAEGAFGPPTPLPGSVGDGALDVAPDGTAVIAWRFVDDQAMGQAAASVRDPGGSFGPVAVLSSLPDGVTDPRAAAGPNGSATVVWERYVRDESDRADPIAVQAATRAPGSEFSAGADVNPAGTIARHAALDTDPRGRTTVAWSEDDARIRAATRPFRGTFGAPVTITAGDGLIRLASDAAGDTAMALVRFDARVLATVRPNGGAFAPPTAVSDPTLFAGVASIGVGSATDAAVAWTQSDGTHAQVSASLLGPGAPGARPAITGFTLSPRTFRAATSGPSLARVKSGTSAVLRLSIAADVRFSVEKAARKGRFKAIKGSFALKGKAGKNRFRFSGRLGGETLAPGTYRLVATPRAAGVNGRSATVTFKVRR